MSSPILLLCSLPPLAVLAVAVIHGVRTGSAPVLATLSLSALVVSASLMLPLMRDDVPVQTLRFAPPESNGVASAPEATHPVRLSRRSEPQALYR